MKLILSKRIGLVHFLGCRAVSPGTPPGLPEADRKNVFMDMISCPHCNAHRIVSRDMPKEVVIVVPCPSCQELTILFRGKAIPLDKKIIESGTFDERKEHFAGIIAEFLEAGVFPMDIDIALNAGSDEDGAQLGEEGEMLEEFTPISDEEFQKFVRIDLKCLDNDAYFKRNFRP